MQFPSWLRPLASLLGRAPTRRKPATRVRAFRPRLERLEDRCVPATFTVTNTLDDGLTGSTGSLRWAITQANADTSPGDEIAFAITADSDSAVGGTGYNQECHGGYKRLTGWILRL
jgi:hypothetical protein